MAQASLLAHTDAVGVLPIRPLRALHGERIVRRRSPDRAVRPCRYPLPLPHHQRHHHGIVDELQITNSAAVTLSITNLTGGGRRAQLGILGTGGGGGGSSSLTTNDIHLLIDSNNTANAFETQSQALALSNTLNATMILTAGVLQAEINNLPTGSGLTALSNTLNATMLSTAGVLQAEINNLPTGSGLTTLSNSLIGAIGATNAATLSALQSATNAVNATMLSTAAVLQAEINNLPTGSGLIALSNNLVAAINATNDALRNGSEALTNGLALVSITNGFAKISITNGLALISATNGLATLSITNGLALTSITNGLALTSITNGLALTSITNGLAQFAITNGLATFGVTNGFINNVVSGGQSGNGSVAIGGNTATVTFPAGASVTGTNSVAGINSLVSNVTITATGNATLTTTASATGGTITLNVPQEFSVTNTSMSTPLWWSTKYGAMRVSNVFGATFVNTPDIATSSNENATLTDYFTTTTTSAWIQVNFSSAWTVVNSNNWLWITSSGEASTPGRYLVKAIPTTNQSWRCRILIQPLIGENGTSTFNFGAGIVSMDDTNSTCHVFTMWRNSSATAALRAFAPSTPGATYNTVDSGVDSSSVAQWWGGGNPNLEGGPNAAFWMQISYDGSMTQKYTYCLSAIALPPTLANHYTFIKTNQTINPKYVGIGFQDSSSEAPTIAIKAFVFEQP